MTDWVNLPTGTKMSPFRRPELLCFNESSYNNDEQVFGEFPFRRPELLCFNDSLMEGFSRGDFEVSIPSTGIAVFQLDTLGTYRYTVLRFHSARRNCCVSTL